MEYALGTETRVEVRAPPIEVFAFLDDQEALGKHMTRRSAMMAGGRMTYQLDGAKGRTVGSVIRMRGEMLGLRLEVQEVVTERIPPRRKVVETTGAQKMLVIDAYRLGFEIEPKGEHSTVRVFVDYNPPRGPLSFLSRPAARMYARWCVTSMAHAVQERFDRTSALDDTREQTGA